MNCKMCQRCQKILPNNSVLENQAVWVFCSGTGASDEYVPYEGGEEDDEEDHHVLLVQDFALDKHLVTVF